MKAILVFENYSTDEKIIKEFTVPNNVTKKTVDRFNRIEEDLIENHVSEYEDFGMTIYYKNYEFIDMEELIEYILDL